MPPDDGPADTSLIEVLERARTAGFLGPGPVRAHVTHARSFLDALPRDIDLMVDLGSGGGVPALPLLLDRLQLRGVLVESMRKRAHFLEWAVDTLGLADRVTVRVERAEVAAHQPDLHRAADVVTARGFASPAVTAECAVGFLRVGGRLIVSEPPSSVGRWPDGPLADLGLGPAERRGSVAVLQFHGPVPGGRTYPRRTNQLVKRPLF